MPDEGRGEGGFCKWAGRGGGGFKEGIIAMSIFLTLFTGPVSPLAPHQESFACFMFA